MVMKTARAGAERRTGYRVPYPAIGSALGTDEIAAVAEVLRSGDTRASARFGRNGSI